jgi:hypothetical protein
MDMQDTLERQHAPAGEELCAWVTAMAGGSAVKSKIQSGKRRAGPATQTPEAAAHCLVGVCERAMSAGIVGRVELQAQDDDVVVVVAAAAVGANVAVGVVVGTVAGNEADVVGIGAVGLVMEAMVAGETVLAPFLRIAAMPLSAPRTPHAAAGLISGCVWTGVYLGGQMGVQERRLTPSAKMSPKAEIPWGQYQRRRLKRSATVHRSMAGRTCPLPAWLVASWLHLE